MAEVNDPGGGARAPIHPAIQRAREMRQAAGLAPSLVSADVLSRVLAVFKQQRVEGSERVRSVRRDDAA